MLRTMLFALLASAHSMLPSETPTVHIDLTIIAPHQLPPAWANLPQFVNGAVLVNPFKSPNPALDYSAHFKVRALAVTLTRRPPRYLAHRI